MQCGVPIPSGLTTCQVILEIALSQTLHFVLHSDLLSARELVCKRSRVCRSFNRNDELGEDQPKTTHVKVTGLTVSDVYVYSAVPRSTGPSTKPERPSKSNRRVRIETLPSAGSLIRPNPETLISYEA